MTCQVHVHHDQQESLRMIETPSQTHAYQDKRIECLTNQQCPRQHILERFPRCSTPLPSTLRIVNCLYPGYPYMTGFQLAFGSTSRSLLCTSKFSTKSERSGSSTRQVGRGHCGKTQSRTRSAASRYFPRYRAEGKGFSETCGH